MTKDRLPALKAAQGEADEDEVHVNLNSAVFMEEFFNSVIIIIQIKSCYFHSNIFR